MQQSTHIIIQARMGSTRLPGKILRPFVGSYTFLEWIVERCRTSQTVSKVIVATATNPKDDEIEALCKVKGYDYVRGSEEDVLARYYNVARRFGSNTVVRVTADNPLVDIAELDRLVQVRAEENLDYATNHPAGLPLGTGCEVFTMAAFERVYAEAEDPYSHEHVTPYFYRHPELFTQKEIAPLNPHPFSSSARLTLDTPQDLAFLTSLAQSIGLFDPTRQPNTNEILSYLERHPELVALNQKVEQKTFPET